MATGSLGQGICAAIGIAANARLIGSATGPTCCSATARPPKDPSGKRPTSAPTSSLDNLCAIVDVNALGQSGPTQFGHNMDELARRWTAFGWHSLVIDGHDMPAILTALKKARETTGRPSVILARTLKGKGVASVEGKEGWHGKAFKKGEEADRAIAELEKQLVARRRDARHSPSDRNPGAPRPAPDYSKLARSGLQEG